MNTLLLNIDSLIEFFLDNEYLIGIVTIILFLLFLKESVKSIHNSKFYFNAFVYLCAFLIYLIMFFALLKNKNYL